MFFEQALIQQLSVKQLLFVKINCCAFDKRLRNLSCGKCCSAIKLVVHFPMNIQKVLLIFELFQLSGRLSFSTEMFNSFSKLFETFQSFKLQKVNKTNSKKFWKDRFRKENKIGKAS